MPTADCREPSGWPTAEIANRQSPIANRVPTAGNPLGGRLLGREEAEPVQDPRLRQACQDFESFLLLYLFREMRKTAEVPGGALPSSSSSQILRDLSEETAVQQLVAQLHCGLADLLYSALKSNVGVME